VIEDNTKQVKKVAHIESQARWFDSVLAELQREHEDRIFDDDYALSVDTDAQMARDCIFRLVARLRGYSEEEIYAGMV
jgi:hypothetical protein